MKWAAILAFFAAGFVAALTAPPPSKAQNVTANKSNHSNSKLPFQNVQQIAKQITQLLSSQQRLPLQLQLSNPKTVSSRIVAKTETGNYSEVMNDHRVLISTVMKALGQVNDSLIKLFNNFLALAEMAGVTDRIQNVVNTAAEEAMELMFRTLVAGGSLEPEKRLDYYRDQIKYFARIYNEAFYRIGSIYLKAGRLSELFWIWYDFGAEVNKVYASTWNLLYPVLPPDIVAAISKSKVGRNNNKLIIPIHPLSSFKLIQKFARVNS